MEFEKTKRQKVSINNENQSPYSFWINFYTTPPNYKVSLQEIEDMITERLKILKSIDSFLKNSENKRNKAFYDVMISQINAIKGSHDKNFYIAGRPTEMNVKVFDARKRDHISHFLLRIYYCQAEDLRKWFISREVELFRLRFVDSSMTNSTILQECLAHYGYKYEIVSIDEKVDLYDKINWNEPNKSNLSMIAFKLKFEDALDLIRVRKVYVNQGYAYIAANEMISVICSQFRLNLSRELVRMHTNFYSFGEKRLVSRLDSLHQEFVEDKKARVIEKSNGNSVMISSDMIDQMSKELFPPCMRSIHDSMRKDHHLKHYGRLYYGLYLKSAGLPLDQAIDFFRSEFSILNPEKFQKEYSYTIRYIYGKEGKRVRLSAYSCQKIISENAPGPTDSHGCPFKHYDINNLKALLIRYGVNDESDLNQIITLVTTDKNFTGACTKYFSAKYSNNLPKSGIIYHPNQFLNDAHSVLYSPEIALPVDTPIADLDVTISGDTTVDSLNDSILEETLEGDILNETNEI